MYRARRGAARPQHDTGMLPAGAIGYHHQVPLDEPAKVRQGLAAFAKVGGVVPVRRRRGSPCRLRGREPRRRGGVRQNLRPAARRPVLCARRLRTGRRHDPRRERGAAMRTACPGRVRRGHSAFAGPTSGRTAHYGCENFGGGTHLREGGQVRARRPLKWICVRRDRLVSRPCEFERVQGEPLHPLTVGIVFAVGCGAHCSYPDRLRCWFRCTVWRTRRAGRRSR